MKEIPLEEQRKFAIHLLRSGQTPDQVALHVNRSRGWVYKWRKRFEDNQSFSSLQSRSRAPRTNSTQLSEEMKQRIKFARSELEAKKEESDGKVKIGSKAVQEQLKEYGCKNLPSEASIERVLRLTGVTGRYQNCYADSKFKNENPRDSINKSKTNIDFPVESEESIRKTNETQVVWKRKEKLTKEANNTSLDSIESDKNWIHKLVQGKVNLDELKEMFTSVLELSDIQKLHRYVLNEPLRQRNRAAILLSHLKGKSKTTIASSLLVSRAGIDKCVKRYEAKGIDELLNPSWDIAKKSDDPRHEEAIFAILHAPPSSFGINRTTWRMKDIKLVMSTQGLEMSEGYIRNIIKDAGYKVRKAKKVLTSKDPDYKEKVQYIKHILSKLGEKEKFFSIDEYGPISIKLHGGRSLVAPGELKLIPQYQESKGSLVITAALELSTNQITHFYSDKKDTEEMLKLLDILLVDYREEECLYLSWDAASWHCSKKFIERVDEVNGNEYKMEHGTPDIKLAPLPSGAQFLNVIESVFSGMARAIIHNSDYESTQDCMVAIDRHIADRNDNFMKNPKRAGNKIWGKERVKSEFKESNNCKDPRYRN